MKYDENRGGNGTKHGGTNKMQAQEVDGEVHREGKKITQGGGGRGQRKTNEGDRKRTVERTEKHIGERTEKHAGERTEKRIGGTIT